MTQYPYILYPRKVEAIARAFPPQPSLVLVAAPAQPIIPAKPEPPAENVLVNILLRFRPTPFNPPIWGVATALAAVLSFSAGNTSLFVSLLVLITLSVWAYRSTYRTRVALYGELSSFKKDKDERYRRQLNQWNINKEEIEKKYRLEVKRVNAENERMQEKYERDKQTAQKPEYIEQWRQEQRRSITASLNPLPLREEAVGFKHKGYAEYEDNCAFPSLITTYFPDKIKVLHYWKRGKKKRVPDFAYTDGTLFIDIELDEPYTPRQYPDFGSLKLTHCIGDSEYDDRDEEFINSDWVVIHFSERQALQQPKACCKEIARMIAYCTGDESILSAFSGVPDLTPERRWTLHEAEAMAHRRERLRYS
ncbi:MAG: hypothetical protein N5P05_004218 (plasmid) [Chroococcopsis gigantea SAG 12.99]|jgi:hypothetical protein|nr:hypothetical protein [Chroococcopsis gigantea SAG 12.99]